MPAIVASMVYHLDGNLTTVNAHVTMALWVRSVSSSCVPLRIAAVMAISVATDQIAPAAVLKVSLVALVSWSCVLKLGTAADMAAHRARCKKDAPAPVMQASMDPNVNSNTVTLRLQ